MDTKHLIDVISKQGGEIDALTSALFAICEAIEPNSELAKQISYRLEQNYSGKLQGALSQPYLEGLEETMDLLKEALQSPPTGCTAQSGDH